MLVRFHGSKILMVTEDNDRRTSSGGMAVDALARSANLLPQYRAKLTKQAKEGADWLIKLQHPSGVFPFLSVQD